MTTGTAGARADPGQAALLLGVYLRLSLRRSTRGFRAARGSRVPSIVSSLVFYAVFGALISVSAWQGPNLFTFALLVHSVTVFAVMTAVGLVASDVLLSPSEQDVLGPRPISAATLLLAKSANLAVYAIVLASAINLVPMFSGLAVRGARGWFPLVHWLGSAMLALLCAGLLVLLYAVLMRFVSRERFEHAATWTQILLTAGILGATHLLPRFTETYPRLGLPSAPAWLLALPPTWFAALDAALAGPRGDPASLALGLGGCLLTVAVYAAAIGRLAPAFGEGLTRLGEARAPGPRRQEARPVRDAAPPGVLRPWLHDPVEVAVYRLAARYMRRDREVMLRLYPALAPLAAPLLIAGVQGREGAPVFLFALAFVVGYVPMAGMAALEASSQHAAAEVFRRAPLTSAAALFHGARKAVLVRLVAPALLLVLALAAFLAPDRGATLLALLPGIVILPLITLMPGLAGPWAPLSMPTMRGMQQARLFGLYLLALLLPGSVLALGWLALRSGWFWPFLGVEIGLAAVLHGLFLARIRYGGRIGPAEE